MNQHNVRVLMFLSCVEARFDGNSEIVAELVTSNGFKAAYAIKDGAEGSRGWVVSAHIVFLLHLLDTTHYAAIELYLWNL